MQTVVYDGSYEGFLSAVFDVYEYKLTDVELVPAHRHQPSMFAEPHYVNHDPVHSQRVLKGLEKNLSPTGLINVYRTFLSETEGIENTLLRFIQYVFSSAVSIEEDFTNADVLAVSQTARKVWREKHRMEAFVRFQKTADELYYAVIEPDHNVLPLIAEHFKTRYADQRWMIYDVRRRYGMYYDLNEASPVQIKFSTELAEGTAVQPVYDSNESIYQQLWKQYFKSVNIPARKNTKLHIQHMPRRYWKFLPEKQPQPQGGLHERLTEWTHRRA